MKIQELHLSNRVTHALLNSGITTVEKLTMYTREQLREMRFIGAGALAEINAVLDSAGISLKTRADHPVTLDTPIERLSERNDELYLGPPAMNALRRAGVQTVLDLMEVKDLQGIKYLGPVKAKEIEGVRERLREKLL